jgi:hypothetical protein
MIAPEDNSPERKNRRRAGRFRPSPYSPTNLKIERQKTRTFVISKTKAKVSRKVDPGHPSAYLTQMTGTGGQVAAQNHPKSGSHVDFGVDVQVLRSNSGAALFRFTRKIWRIYDDRSLANKRFSV